jgi:8-oxo-dGTP diphosphatase
LLVVERSHRGPVHALGKRASARIRGFESHPLRQEIYNMAGEKEKWKREFSAGGVVYKKEHGQIFILLLMPMGRDFGPPKGYWAFPKGKIDEGEDQSQTAVREVDEEAGVKAKIQEDLKSIKFFRNYDKTLKFVHYYLMEYVSGDPKDHDKEVSKAEWVALDEVEKRLKFPADKEVFARAKKVLDNII